jgi:protein-S-isoprenylcysteine O-methyltransferase Ste14
MSSRLPTLGPRGEGWVALQGVILIALGWAGTLGPAWDGLARLVSMVAGAMLLLGGGTLAARGLLDLRENLTALPHPRDGATLVDRGAYHRVRHPIYGGLVLAGFGWGLVWASPAALAIAALLVVFFDLKSRREEAWLADRFADYPAYRARTRRLIPFVY